MIRVLIVEDDSASAELTLEVLERAGFPCVGECVSSEQHFRDALERAPDIILSDSNLPGFDGAAALAIARTARPNIPFVFFSGSVEDSKVRSALARGASGWIAKSDASALVNTVRAALRRARGQAHGESTHSEPTETAVSLDDTASFLLERRARVDRTLQTEAPSSLSSILSNTPPAPAALIFIRDPSTRDRYLKLLANAHIETEIAAEFGGAMARLAERIHALLFTDRLDLVRAARQLQAGAATHMLFVGSSDQAASAAALQAGANDVLSERGQGAQFWAALTNAYRLVSFAASLRSAVSDNRILSTIDNLTRCGNRRYFELQLPKEVEQASVFQRPISLLMCDIDHFKRINDRHGHPVGDEVLQEFSQRILQGLRAGEDWVARIGGEEFAVVLPETSCFEGLAIAQRLCDRVSGAMFSTTAGEIPVSASFGVCGYQGGSRDVSELVRQMVTAADAALYESKKAGRNRVTELSVALAPTGRKRTQG
jgi:two-component system, cell cycle response regulator